MSVTVFVLFGDDIRLLLCPPSYDAVFGFLNGGAFFLFLLELILTSWAKSDFTKGIFKVKGYMFGFFFWLDLLAILSMLPNLTWIYSLSTSLQQGEFNLGIAGKAGKIGSKAARVVRMARLVRLVKLYKFTSQRRREKKMVNDLSHLVEDGRIDTAIFGFCDIHEFYIGA